MELQSEKIDLIVTSLVAARGSFKAAVKDAKNAAFKRPDGKVSTYTTLDSAIEAVNEALLANGIYYTQQTDIGERGIVLHTRFLHTSGQWIGSAYPVHPVKNDPQGEGSALTYARRYALMALAGIAPEDDDGNAATKAAERDNAADDAAAQEWIDAINAVGTREEYESAKAEMMAAFRNNPPKQVKAAFGAQLKRLPVAEAA